ncbi:MAG: DegT/DnrJ/EryC1/StrS family aminotransferase [Bacillota bacterium]
MILLDPLYDLPDTSSEPDRYDISSLEEALRNSLRARHLYTTSSGRSGLRSALTALKIKMGDKLAVPAYTYCSVIEEVVSAGATPVLVDVDEDTYNIRPESLRQVLAQEEGITGVIVSHLFGQCANMQSLVGITRDAGLLLIEDCGGSFGSAHKEQLAGTFGDIAVFSFAHGSAIHVGHGGAVVARSEETGERLSQMLTERMDPRYTRLARERLRNVLTANARRRYNAVYYYTRIDSPYVSVPREGCRCFHIYTRYILRVREVQTFIAHMRRRGVEASVPGPSLLSEYFHEAKSPILCRSAERAARETVCIPVHEQLSREQLERVAEAVAQYSPGVHGRSDSH